MRTPPLTPDYTPRPLHSSPVGTPRSRALERTEIPFLSVSDVFFLLHAVTEINKENLSAVKSIIEDLAFPPSVNSTRCLPLLFHRTRIYPPSDSLHSDRNGQTVLHVVANIPCAPDVRASDYLRILANVFERSTQGSLEKTDSRGQSAMRLAIEKNNQELAESINIAISIKASSAESGRLERRVENIVLFDYTPPDAPRGG